MKSGNKIYQPIYIILATFIIAAAFSFIPEGFEIFGIPTKHVDIFSDLRIREEAAVDQEEIQSDSNSDEYEYKGEMEIIEDEDSSGAQNDSSLKTEKDKVNRASMLGAVSFVFEKLSEAVSDRTFVSGFSAAKGQKITGYVSQLKHFFKALDKSKSKQVRIAHFGDSLIEGDLITAELRNVFQTKFGGRGVGWLSVTSQDTKFRQSTKHTFSNTWDMYSIYTRNPKHLPLGISGEIFLPKKDGWMMYQATRKYRTMKYYDRVRLFYSHAKSGSIKYSLNGRKAQSKRLTKGNNIQQLVIDSKKTSKVKFEVPKDAGYFYGVSLESKTGVYVDNFPLRGNSGVDLKNIGDSELKSFAKLMKYDLIILEFGLNAVGQIKGNYRWYEQEMTKVVNKFKKDFPNTSILLVSVHDKAKRKGGKFVTDPEILKLLTAQQRVAKNTKVAFWNMFEAMGGKNSMNSWVTANPPLAFKDYVHFNDQGAKKIAEMMADALIKAYRK